MRYQPQFLLIFLSIGVLGACFLLTTPQTRVSTLRVTSKPITETAIIWKDCPAADLDKLPDDHNHVVTVGADWDPITTARFVQIILETPELRKLVSSRGI